MSRAYLDPKEPTLSGAPYNGFCIYVLKKAGYFGVKVGLRDRV